MNPKKLSEKLEKQLNRFRFKKVQRLKEQVSSGAYNVTALRVAKSIVTSGIEEQ